MTAAELVGRTAELELIDALLHRRDGVGPGLLLRGTFGVGKTALLDAAAAQAAADGMRVLPAVGVEFESEIRFSALHQMLYPLREHVDRLAGHHRDVLDEIFDLAPGSSPVPLVASAVLALLAEVAAERPVLVLVDDLPWVDEASASRAGVRRASRRLRADRVPGRRTNPVPSAFFDQLNLPRTRHRAARPAAGGRAAGHSLARAGADGTAAVAGRGRGNPLVLRELPDALTDRQRSGQDPLPKFLTLSGRLELTATAEFERLPAPTRKVLLLAALDNRARLATVADGGAWQRKRRRSRPRR